MSISEVIVGLKFQVEGTNDTLIMWVVGSAAEYVDQLGDKEILEQAGKLLRFIISNFIELLTSLNIV